MKKSFTSKAFLVLLLAILCVGVTVACLIWRANRSGNFTPDPVESQGVDQWRENVSIANSDDLDSADTNSGDKNTEQYPKVVAEDDDEVSVDFTPPRSPADAEPPAAPNGKTEIKDLVSGHTPNIAPEVSTPAPKPDDPSGPVPGSTNDKGEFYDPAFGWVKPGVVVQEEIDSDGDPNKMVGNMG